MSRSPHPERHCAAPPNAHLIVHNLFQTVATVGIRCNLNHQVYVVLQVWSSAVRLQHHANDAKHFTERYELRKRYHMRLRNMYIFCILSSCHEWRVCGWRQVENVLDFRGNSNHLIVVYLVTITESDTANVHGDCRSQRITCARKRTI